MKKVKKETQEIEREEIYCDFCGNRTWINLDKGVHLTVQSEDSYNYGTDGGCSKEFIYDICGDCVKKILFPYVKKKIKKEPRTEEYEW